MAKTTKTAFVNNDRGNRALNSLFTNRNRETRGLDGIDRRKKRG